jgi:hypothetical protein
MESFPDIFIQIDRNSFNKFTKNINLQINNKTNLSGIEIQLNLRDYDIFKKEINWAENKRVLPKNMNLLNRILPSKIFQTVSELPLNFKIPSNAQENIINLNEIGDFKDVIICVRPIKGPRPEPDQPNIERPDVERRKVEPEYK